MAIERSLTENVTAGVAAAADTVPPAAVYVYRCRDNSLIRAYVVPYFELYFRIVPRWLPANLITLGGDLGMLGVLALLVAGGPGERSTFALCFAIALHFYAISDHLDGWQAKRTATSAPLGQFFDHYFDSYVGAIVVVGCAALMEGLGRPTIFLALWLHAMAFAASNAEERERGEFHFSTVSALEGIVVVMVFLLSFLFPGGEALWQRELTPGVRGYWLLVAPFLVGFAWTVTAAVRRIGYWPRPLLAFTGASFALFLAASLGGAELATGALALTLFAGDWIARVIGSRLLGRPHPYPDAVGSAAILVLLALAVSRLADLAIFDPLFLLLVVWSGARMVASTARILYELRAGWVWINPARSTASTGTFPAP